MKKVMCFIIGMMVWYSNQSTSATGSLVAQAMEQDLFGQSIVGQHIINQSDREDCGLFKLDSQDLKQSFYTGISLFERWKLVFDRSPTADEVVLWTTSGCLPEKPKTDRRKQCMVADLGDLYYPLKSITEDEDRTRFLLLMVGVEKARTFLSDSENQLSHSDIDKPSVYKKWFTVGFQVGVAVGVTASLGFGVKMVYDKLAKDYQWLINTDVV
ncbi:MAG: hypothetical protein LBJ92_04830 [Holosporales bacterium]|jgi:hypothetical protein|nr:hypothetical protein [Holosporales bacterium]